MQPLFPIVRCAAPSVHGRGLQNSDPQLGFALSSSVMGRLGPPRKSAAQNLLTCEGPVLACR